MTAQDAEYTRVPASPPTPHVNGQVEVWESVQWETLRVGYWHEGPFGRALEREWGDDHLLDSHVYDGNGLTVIGLDETPETCGLFAADWLRRQLERPVERLDWLRGEQVKESAWRLADSGKTFARMGWSVRRPGKIPSRIQRVR